MRYPIVPIGELVTLRQGFAINKNTKHHMSDVPTTLHLLRIGDMKEGAFSVFVKDTIPSHFIATEKDIIYTRTGQVGLVFRNQYGVIHNNCFTVTPKDDLQLARNYLFYVLQSKDFYDEANAKASGAAQPDLPHGAFNSIYIPFPPISKQNKIASVLSTYDNLIENNQKQIKLLEEASQRLYKEWFIDLRFPGYETTLVHDGVPEGWEKCILKTVSKVNAYSLPKNYAFDYLDYIDLSAVSAGRIDESTRYSLTDAPGRAKRVAHDGDVIWGMVRPNLKSYALVLHPSDTDVFSTGFAILSAEKVPFTYLYCVVTQPSFVSYLVNCTNGAAYPAVRPEHFEKAIIVKPTDEILRRFHETVEPLFRIIETLQNQSRRLTEARDRLLPKLMSGEIEV